MIAVFVIILRKPFNSAFIVLNNTSTSSIQSGSKRRSVFYWVLLGLSSLVTLSITTLAIGTFFPSLPYIGVIGSSWLGSNPLRMLIATMIGVLLSGAAICVRRTRLSITLLSIGIATVTAVLVVLLSQLRVAAENGAHIDILKTLYTEGYGEDATPDETIEYLTTSTDRLQLDVYRPTSKPGILSPIVIYIHGGGWTALDRKAQARNLRWFADQGFLAFSPDYTLATKQLPTWNIAGPQVACALTWIAENAHRYGGDTSRIYVYGESAGGALALAASYAITSGTSEFTCNRKAPTIRAVAANVPAVDVTSFYKNDDAMLGDFSQSIVKQYLGGSPEDYPERVRFVAPSTYITPQAPPTLLFLSSNDHLVPIEGAEQFIVQAEQAGIDVRAIRFPYGDHSLSTQYYSIANQAMLQIMLQHFQ